MSILNYEVSFSPAEPKIGLELMADNITLKVKIDSYESFNINCKPAGNIIEKAFSIVAWPVAELIKNGLQKKLIEFLDSMVGKSEKISQVPNLPITYEGVTITLQPSGITLSNYNGMLMAEANIDIV
jgi:hypothetical protein